MKYITSLLCRLLAIILWALSAAGAVEPRFAPPIKYLVGSGTNSVAAVDLNNDGKVDLVVTTRNDANVYVLLGRGDGSFDNPVAYPAGTTAFVGSVVADFNHDGKPDVAAVTAVTSGTSSVLVLLGNGDGTFGSTPLTSGTSVSARSVRLGDINDDGSPDLLIGAIGPPSVLLSNGDGTFGAPIVLPLPTNITGVYFIPSLAAGDFNQDGRLDLAGLAAGSSVTAAVVYLQNSDGSFQVPSGYLHGHYTNPPVDIFVADINRDGFLDILTTNNSFLDIYTGMGDGTFQIPTTSQYAGSTPTMLVFADFNSDGTLDLAAANANSSTYGSPSGLGVTVVPIEADGTIATNYRQFDVGSSPVGIASADFNGDGKPDLVTANPSTNSISILLNGANTVVTLAGSPNPVIPGNSVTLTASVAAASGNPPPATGTVAFYDGATLLGSALLDLTATATLNTIPASGIHRINALYSGDQNYIGSSATSTVSVGYPSTTTLDYSPLNPVQGQAVTLSATVSSAYADVNPGTVSFYDGNKFLASVALVNGAASTQTSVLSLGSHTIRANYFPSPSPPRNLLTSSASVTFTVAFNPNTIVIGASSAPRADAPVHLSAAVSALSGTPTGNVTFTDGATTLGTSPLSNGTASIVTSALAEGPRTIHIAYQGDGTYNPASSNLALQVASSTGPTPMAGPYGFVGAGSGAMVYDPIRQRVYVNNPTYARIDVVDAQTRTVIGNFPASSVNALDVSVDGANVFVANNYGIVLKVDAQSLQLVGTYWPPVASLSALRVLSDGTLLIFANYSHALRWDYSTGATTDLNISPSSMAISGNRAKVLLLAGNTVSVYDVASASVTASKTYASGYLGSSNMAANYDGSRFAVNGGSFISVLNGALFEQYQISVNLYQPIFAWDSTKLFVTGGSYTLAAYEVASGNLLASYPNISSGPSSSISYQTVTTAGILIGVSSFGLVFMDPARAASVTVPTSNPWASFTLSSSLGPADAASLLTAQITAPLAMYFGDGVTQTAAASSTSFLVLAPATETPGPVHVIGVQGNQFPVLMPYGFSYGPRIDRIETNAGAPAGGAPLRLFGYGFGSNPQVKVGGVSASSVQVTNPGNYYEPAALQVINATTPPGTPGNNADISVTNTSGTATVAKSYTYLKAVNTYAKGGPLTALLYDPGRKYVYVANSSKIEIFDVQTRTFKAPIYPPSATANSAFGRMSLNADGSRLVATDTGDSLLHVVDPDTGSSTSISLLPLKDPSTSTLFGNSVALMSDGKLFLATQQAGCSGCSNTLAIVDLASGTLTRVATSGYYSGSTPVVPVNSGTRIMTGITGAYDVANSTLLLSPYSTYSYSETGGFSSNGRHGLASATSLLDDNFRTVQGLNQQGRSDLGSSTSLAFGPAGGLLFRAGSAYTPLNALDLYDVNTGWLRSRITLPEAPKSGTLAGLISDDTGETWFLSTATGVTILEFQKLPLSVGAVYPLRNAAQGGHQVYITGSGFAAGTTVTIGDQPVVPTVVNSQTLTFTAPALSNGCYAITLANPGGESYILPCGYNVPTGAGAPTLTSIDPASGTAPVNSVTMTVKGSNFTPDSQVVFNGMPLYTAYQSPTSLKAQPTTNGLAGNYEVRVLNPDPDGGLSSAVAFSVTNPYPYAYNTNPSVVFTGSATQTVTLNGSGFVPNSVLKFGGTPRAFTYVNSGSLQFMVTAQEMATPSTYGIEVTNPAPGGGSSSTSLKVVDQIPSLQFSPTTVNMGSAPVGGASNYDAYITVNNVGYDTLKITSVSVSGNFEITSTTCNNAELPYSYYNSYCSVNVKFVPTELGVRNGALTVIDNASGSPHTLALTGTGVANVPLVYLSPVQGLDFGSLNIGASSAVYSVSVNNNGYDVLNISSVSLTGSDFSITSNTCGSSLAVGGWCYIYVKFTPSAGGQRTGTVSIIDNAAGSPHTAPLKGYGINGTASWSITAINFDPVLVGSTGASIQVTLTNTGSAPLVFGGFNVSGEFTQTNNCPVALAPGDSCIVNITFTPHTLGAMTGSIAAKSGDQPPISLSGTGADLALSLIRASRRSRDGAQQGSSRAEVRLSSAARATVELSCTGAPADALCLLSNQSVQLSGKAPSSVQLELLAKPGATLPQGVYPVQVRVASGPLVRTIDVPLEISAGAQMLSVTQGARRTASAGQEGSVDSPEKRPMPSISLRENPEPALLNVTPATLVFSREDSAKQEVKVSNVGTVAAEGIKIEVPPGFEQTNDCSGLLQPGATCTIAVTPTTGAKSGGNMRVTADRGSSTVSIRLK